MQDTTDTQYMTRIGEDTFRDWPAYQVPSQVEKLSWLKNG